MSHGTSTTKSSSRHTKLATTACATIMALGTVVSVGVAPTPASAQFIDRALYDGGKARVNRSASLRSLTERVASASCRLEAGIDQATAQADLTSAREDFDAILVGLEKGDNALGMPGAETRPRTVAAIQATAELWQPIEVAANRMLDGSGSAADATMISQSYGDLFEQTVVLAADVSGQYSDPQELLQSDATVLNFAVRQRALAYRMTRVMCELATGTGDDGTVSELGDTLDLFERTLAALRDGFPDAGINPPPNDAVRNSLEQTLEIWETQRGIFSAAVSGQQPSSDDVIAAAALTGKLSVAMNNTITLYLIATPGQDGVYRVPLEAYARGELAKWIEDPALIEAIKVQNDRHTGLTEDEVIALDQQWRAEAGDGGGPLISELLAHPVSAWLRGQQTATAGFVTEVFVMDDKGLNVAQSVETSDYWQGDEAKWKETYQVGPDALHISEVEFDDSTGFYQSQASLAIKDPSSGEVIGAITFGINVQNLM
ncbi:type IV pili methyl-accepting chemotaxis transducer N-terminal domain-containing protein [Cognatiyoonia sp. IB215446]|uniref:type IV pili methyl-accepting chemotaxis transducer N-terminal domain-containing protein n=1 Tax=Cognatiyoonia sp. IB215446 TaxID=3097355 RepID=UPI002A0E481C|nr:type IV pili methyl-accepting chemotaxis transducer N-terminal domain-containing protein [Cognatiyoonia sp. IB215446]MDX8347876.1 type IV pili methyl-accepting chemotaxis transducer N-terminal domain-containing protein [Cognatiyoonia sp. IB215446]